MNILFLMGQYPSIGGVEKVSTVLANEFIRRGHQVDIVSFEQPMPEIAVKELDKSVKLHSLSFPVSKKENLHALREIIRNRRIDFIINQWAVPFYVARLCRRAIKGTDCKLITVHHNLPDTNARIKAVELDIENNRGNRQINRLKLGAIRTVSRINLRGVYHLSDLYIVLSDSFKKIACKYMCINDAKKMLALSNPVTIIRDESKPIAKEKEIIYVGRIKYNQKRTDRIIEIWQSLSSKFPEWKFTIIGDGPDRKDLEKKIKDRHLDRIQIVGFKNPLPFYQRASLLLMVSEYEGFPLVLAEAMKFGCVPVVLSTFPAVNDIIGKSNGIKISPPYDPNEIINALAKVMGSPESLAILSSHAQTSVSKFSLDIISNEWENIFHSFTSIRK